MIKWEGKDKLLFKIDRIKIESRWPGSVLNIELNMKLNECSQKIFQKETPGFFPPLIDRYSGKGGGLERKVRIPLEF